MKKYTTKRLDIQHILDSASVFLLVQYNDLSSVEWRVLRRKLLSLGCYAKVVQNRKASKVLQETKYIHLGEALQGPTCFVYNTRAGEESFDLKKLYTFLEEQTKLTLIAGCIDDALVSKEGIVSISKLPKKQELHGQILAQLSSRGSHFASLLDGQRGVLLNVLDRSLQKPMHILQAIT